METFEFLSVEGEKLYSVIHEPDTRLDAAGVLMIHPLFEEKLWVGRATTRLARSLADAGLPVMRFDFRGHGDSDREHQEMRLASLRADVLAAARHFRDRCGVEDLHLFGIRFGGTLALHFAQELGAASLGLVNPLPSGGDYLMKVLRSNLTTQLSIYGKVRRDRQILLEQMRKTGLLNIDGYHLSAEFYDEIAALDLASAPPAWRGPGLVLSLARLDESPPDADSREVFAEALAGHPASRLASRAFQAIWTEQKRFSIGGSKLFAPFKKWFTEAWREVAA